MMLWSRVVACVLSEKRLSWKFESIHTLQYTTSMTTSTAYRPPYRHPTPWSVRPCTPDCRAPEPGVLCTVPAVQYQVSIHECSVHYSTKVQGRAYGQCSYSSASTATFIFYWELGNWKLPVEAGHWKRLLPVDLALRLYYIPNITVQ